MTHHRPEPPQRPAWVLIGVPVAVAAVVAAGALVWAAVGQTSSVVPAVAAPVTSASPPSGSASLPPVTALPATPAPAPSLSPCCGKPRLAFLGDSITRGTSDLAAGVFGDRSWFFAMVEGPAAPFTYAGGIADNGMTTAWMAEHAGEALDTNPEMLVVLGGTNDIANWVEPTVVLANLESITQQAHARGIAVAVSTIPPSSFEDLGPRAVAMNVAIRAWVQARGDVVLLDPWTLLADEQGAWLPDLTPDGIHPDADACRLMANDAAARIMAAFGLPAPDLLGSMSGSATGSPSPSM